MKTYSKVVDQEIVVHKRTSFERMIFYILYPDHKGMSPFDYAMEDVSYKCIEEMLDMLSSRPNFNFSKYLRKHF